MALALLKPPLDELSLKAGNALSFVDGATGEPVVAGLRCSLVLRQGGLLLGRAVATPSGVHHWPELADRWLGVLPPAPVLADVIVRDELERFLPLSLPWPLPAGASGQIVGATVLGAVRLLRVSLLSAPARPAPAGLASVHGLLLWQADGKAAAWTRVSHVDGDGRAHEGASDAQGRLTLHLPRPRPDRPGLPPAPAAQLHVFASPALAAAPLPDVLAFAAQPEVKALADVGGTDAYAPPAFVTGEPLILASLGLPAGQRELRLVP